MICCKNYAFSNSNLFWQAKKINMHKTAVKGYKLVALSSPSVVTKGCLNH